MPSDAPSTPDKPVVTFVFSGYGGNVTGACPMEYTGLAIKYYLKSDPLRQHGLLNRATKGGVRNRQGEKVRLTYVPSAGEVIVVR